MSKFHIVQPNARIAKPNLGLELPFLRASAKAGPWRIPRP